MSEDSKPARTDKEIIDEAKKRLADCIDRESDERDLMRDDLRFSTLDQWPKEIRDARESDPNGARPCLTMDQINQYIAQVVNDERQNRPAIKVRPVDDAADVDTAKILQGKCRHIEDLSSASVAYLGAGESAVRIGMGYFRVVTQYESDESFDQEIYIRPCPDPFSVHLGPHSMPDGSDAEYGFVVEDMSVETFEREFPKAKSKAVDFASLTDDDSHWKEENTIRVAEYFYFDYVASELLFLEDGRSIFRQDYEKLPAQPEISEKRNVQKKSVKWCKLSGIEVLDKRDWPGIYIPIVKVVGREAIVDGKKKTWGLVRPSKDALMAFNYWISAITEKMALSPKTPYIGAVGQFATQGQQWDKANAVNYSRLEYDPIDVNGMAVPPPQRQQAMPVETAMLGMLPVFERAVKTALGMFKASVGESDPQQSGRALLALQRESDTGTFHFPDNLATSIRYCGRICVDLIPKVNDVRKMLRLIGEDGEPSVAQIDPEQQVAKREITDAAGKIKRIYNPGVGKYDVTVTTGPSYNTKRMEAAQVFSDLAKGATEPVAAAVMRYLTVKNSDFTSSDEALQMLKSMIPPNILPKEEGQPDIPPQVKQQVMQMQQVIQGAGQKIQELESGEQQAQAKIAADHDAKLKAIQLDGQIAAEKARLAREQFDFDKQLEVDKANHEAWLAEQKVAGEQDGKKKQLEFDQKCRVEDEAHKAEMDVAPKVEDMMAQVEKKFDQIVKLITEKEQTFEIDPEAFMASVEKHRAAAR